LLISKAHVVCNQERRSIKNKHLKDMNRKNENNAEKRFPVKIKTQEKVTGTKKHWNKNK